MGHLRELFTLPSLLIALMGSGVWAWWSYRYNLGPITALHTQYVMAGLLPALLFLCIGLTAYGLSTLLDNLLFILETRPERWAKGLRSAILIIYILSLLLFVVFWFWSRHTHHAPPIAFWGLLLTFCIVLMGALPVTRTATGEPRRPPWNWFAWLGAAYAPTVMGAFFLFVYVSVAYPYLPQEYGGALPRIASLSLVQADLSPQLLAVLVPQKTKNNAPVVQSVPVDVFVQTSESVLIKLHSGRPLYLPRRDTTYEIKASSIKAIAWLK